jgi:predicted TIM-barrel fold metal-dependent hydrolase
MLRSVGLAGVTALAGGMAAAPLFAQSNSKERWGWGSAPHQTLPDSAVNGPWRNLRAVQQKKVFDMHTHGWETPKQGHDYRSEGQEHARDVFVNYADQLIASMDRHGIALAALNPAFTTYEQVRDQSYIPHKDRFILAAGWPPEHINSQRKGLTQTGAETNFTPQDVADEYERQVTRDGARFIGETGGNAIIRGLMPRYTMKELHPVVDMILKHDIPVQIHTGWTPTGTAISAGVGAKYVTASEWAEQVGKFMASFPEVKLILGHTGGQFNHIDGWEAIRLLFSFDNAYCDTSKSRPDIVTEAVKGIGAERDMFGSDWNRPELKAYGPYFMRSSYQHWHNLNTIAEADLTEDQRDWVLYKSAHKLLKISQ